MNCNRTRLAAYPFSPPLSPATSITVVRGERLGVRGQTQLSLRWTVLISACVLIFAERPSRADAPKPHSTADRLIVVCGAGGSDEFTPLFHRWTERWQSAGERGGLHVSIIGLTDDEADDRTQLQQLLTDTVADAPRLWLVLIGHGTFDGRHARFNLRGPDVSADELTEWLAGVACPTAIINCSSASGPFIESLTASERIVVTATRNGQEVNFSRFGDYLSQCIDDLAADLDKDEQVSLLEAFLMASRRTEEFYKGETRLVTEHALIDDDGNGAGTRAEAFQGIHPVRTTTSGSVDGHRAHQWHLVPSDAERSLPPELREQRDTLELEVVRLRDRKADMAEVDYFGELEGILIQLSELYEQAEALEM